MNSSPLSLGKLLLNISKNDGFLCIHKRFLANVSEEAKRQSELFRLERLRQQEAVGRVEKIEIYYEQPSNQTETLVMNKGISTPYDCAKHKGDTVSNRAAIALINGDVFWHMHKPLEESCTIQLLDYNVPQPSIVNKAYWRTCSFLLGAVITNAFKDNVNVQLHSFPSPNVRSGSFIYDAQLSLDNWTPEEKELKSLSLEMIKFCRENYPIECLEVDADFALILFKNNPHKTQQIPNIAANNKGKVSLFKAGHHIDISKGPMICNTSHLGRITIANVFKLDTDIPGGPLYRFQGVSIPQSIVLNHFAYSLLENRAKKLNLARIPGLNRLSDEDGVMKHAVA